MLQPPEPLHASSPVRAAGKLVASDSLQRNNASCTPGFLRRLQCRLLFSTGKTTFPIRGHPPKLRPAGVAGYGLCMSPPHFRAGACLKIHPRIFLPAGRTHVKFPHGDMRSVIGDLFGNAVTGTAVHAAYKRITVSAVIRISHFRKTCLAKRKIRRKKRKIRSVLRFAFHNAKIPRGGFILVYRYRLYPVNPGCRRGT